MKSMYDVAYWFPTEEFATRRERVFEQIGPTACALLQGGGPVRGFEVFRQTNEFFYLCGVETPQAYLLLDGRTHTTALFVPGGNTETLGLDAVYGLDMLEEKLTGITMLYTPYAPPEGRVECRDVLQLYARTVAKDPWDGEVSRGARFRARLNAVLPRAELRDLTPILDALRVIKSPREIELMRYTGKLTGLAVKAALQATAPGLREYQLGAIADGLYRDGGARREGYCAIIASGANIWDGHYNRNDCLLTDGDLVLMDYAPDVCNYTNDIGRMWPVNGTFSAQQRELYGFIVEYHKALLKRLRPGALPREVLAETAEEMRGLLEQTTFSKPIYAEATQKALDFRGHLSHPVGMAVHDVGSYFDVPMQVGLVISIDPMLWVPEEQLYIRVEDTIVITENGCEVLTSHVPFEIAEIEALMKAKVSLVKEP
ncbi:aminopeptidase P N-terminal domain-containing protein [Armatimonas sp.]|uniref:aminopeptidase P N-terminal domain-containing protein n=1 Tax=Armatimonas sp. TaxID=1872638 RepID=UPI00374CEF6C